MSDLAESLALLAVLLVAVAVLVVVLANKIDDE